jgi:hypothetical protein
MASIVHQAREGFLKIALAALLGTSALCGTLGPARADELVVGALRDQDGAVVSGAAVTAVDGRGAVLARDRSAADGTFALSAPAHPAAVLVVADDAEPMRIAVPADGTPLTGIVRRHRATDLVPSVADLAALPAGSPGDAAGIVPYRVAFPGTVSDRWLARGRSATTVEGLPFYRRGDGADLTTLLPSHAFGALDVRDALQSPWYGDRAGGGRIDFRLFDRYDAARASSRDAALEVGRNPAVLAATSWDPGGERRLIAARANQTYGPVRAAFVALAGESPDGHYAGAGLDLRAALRAYDVAAHAGLTADDASLGGTRDDGTVTDVVLDAAGRGPNAIALRARYRFERGALGSTEAQHHDAALVLGTTRGNVVRATAALALAIGDEQSYDIGASAHGTALLPSLALDAPLGANWKLHAGAGASTLGTPGYAVARSSLGEASIAYTDRRRLRAEFVAYTEGNIAPSAVNRGFGASLGWEIAPRLSLRAWALRDGDSLDATALTYPGGPVQEIQIRRRFNRDVVWLTWDAPARFDVLIRGGALEGNVRLPLGARYALTAGSYLGRNAKRALSLGLVAR